ncbi:MAG: sensor histidine kinase [Alkalispirochaeta sp.]
MAIVFNLSYPPDLHAEILACSPSAHLLFEHGVCTYASPSYWNIVGYDEDEALGTEATALPELLHPDDRDTILYAFADAVMRNDPELSMTYRGRRKDGSYIMRNDIARLVYDKDGRHVKTCVAVRIVTPAEATDQDEATRRCNGLLRELMHRTKNDLALIRSILHLQAAGTNDPEAKEALVAAALRVDAVGRTHDHLHQTGDIGETDLIGLIHRSIDDLFEKTGLSASAVDLDLSESIVVSTRIATSVGIIINELITNVAKYAGNAEKELRIGIALTSDTPQTHLLLRVRDGGTGFPETVVRGADLGFGLQMVSALAGQHNGTVRFFNDDGAVVEISIPLDPSY